MRGSLVLVAGGLVGCGRLGFDPVPAMRPDAAPDDTAVRRAPCGAGTTAPDPVTITGATFEFTSFTNTRQMLPDTMVEALDANGLQLDRAFSDANGTYPLSFPTGGVARDISIRYSRSGYLDSRVYLDAPLDRDLAIGDAMVLNPSDGPIWSTGAMTTVYQSAGIPLDPVAGTLNIRFLDCAGQPLAGVQIALSPQPEVGAFLGGGTGVPDQTLPASEVPLAFFIGYNTPAGPTTITATAAAFDFARQTRTVAANENTLLVVRPLEPVP